MNTIGSLQGDVQAVENTINSGNVNSANYTKALKFENVPNNADINNYMQAGLYSCSQNVDVQTMKNTPSQSSFFMLVFVSASNNRPSQLWFDYSGAGVYMRYYQDWSPEGWQPWRALFSK